MDGARVQVVSDGMGSGDVSTLSADHAVSIEPFLADRIEVMKGPATLLYGSGAIGGAVNVVDGRTPDLNPDTLTKRSHAEYQEGKNLKDMVRENLVAERIAIDSYRELIEFIGDKDTTTKRMLMQILAEEEEHADEFADLLNGWIGN